MSKKNFLSSFLSLSILIGAVTMITPIQAATTVTLDLKDTKQVIDGFGVSQAYWSKSIYNLNEPMRTEVLDLLFDAKGIDLDILRGEIFPEFLPSSKVYDFGQHYDQAWVMQEAKARGVEHFMATVWSPPGWMKTNNQTTYGGKLKEENYPDFAGLMAEFVKQYKSLYGIDLDAISMANEPNSMTFLAWNSCEWNGEQMKNFLGSYLKPKFEQENLGSVKIICGEPSWWKETMMQPALDDPNTASFIDIVAAHNYPIPVINTKQPQVPFTNAQNKNKKVWMTEVSSPKTSDLTITSGITLAKEMHTFMTTVGANAYLYWTGAIEGNSDEGLINVDLNNQTYKVSKRFYTFGNFSKFIKPGDVRLEVTKEPLSSVYLSAYENADQNKVVLVMINDNNATKQLDFVPKDFKLTTLTPYITDNTSELLEDVPVYQTNGKFNLTLPPKSVVTYVGNIDEQTSNTNQTFYDALDNFDLVYERTTGAAIDVTNPQYFNNDGARVKRLLETPEHITYHMPNMQSFKATIYHNKEWNDIVFYGSQDAENWYVIPHVSTEGSYIRSGWYQKTYTQKSKFPEGTNYFKIELSGVGAWNKQIGDITIEYLP